MRTVLLAIVVLGLGTSLRAQSDDPSPGDFIDIQKEPQEQVPLELLVHYPDEARRSGLEGNVTLEALIGKDGKVIKVTVTQADYDIFKQAAIDAMMQETYSPAISNGRPTKVWMTRVIHFRLNDNDRTDNRSGNPYLRFIGLSLDSVKELFKKAGAVTETKQPDGIHLHAESAAGYSDGKTPEMFDGIVTSSGLQELTIVYKYRTDEDFNIYTPKSLNHTNDGGQVLTFEMTVEYPNAVMTSAVDAKKRVFTTVVKAK